MERVPGFQARPSLWGRQSWRQAGILAGFLEARPSRRAPFVEARP